MEDFVKEIGVLGGVTTYVDIVFCIDVTASMAPIINTIKNLTLDLNDDLITHMWEKNNRIVKQLRVKVIAFRDYYCDGPYAMEESKFFTLPAQKNEFKRFIESLEANGGGDEPENAMEAMVLAMKSDWIKRNSPYWCVRNVIVVFTDAPAHPLEESRKRDCNSYPLDMPENYEQFYNAWHGLDRAGCSNVTPYSMMDERGKRLLIFAPEESSPWYNIEEDFEWAAVVPISIVTEDIKMCIETIVAVTSTR